jgi:hypothetical protein
MKKQNNDMLNLMTGAVFTGVTVGIIQGSNLPYKNQLSTLAVLPLLSQTLKPLDNAVHKRVR